jgi:RNA-splicing ligase RtcB
MPNTHTKNDGRMNKRQEVMRTTFNTYGHNSNRHLDRKDCKEEIREEEVKKKSGKLKKKLQEHHASPAHCLL